MTYFTRCVVGDENEEEVIPGRNAGNVPRATLPSMDSSPRKVSDSAVTTTYSTRAKLCDKRSGMAIFTLTEPPSFPVARRGPDGSPSTPQAAIIMTSDTAAAAAVFRKQRLANFIAVDF